MYYGAITLLGASPTIQNSTIRDSANYAYRADLNSFPTLTNNTLINNGINGLALTGDVYGTTLNTSATWNITDTTYYIRDAIAIGANKTLTITPGVVVKFEIGRYLLVNGNNSALRGLGTSLSPVTFTSLRDDTVGGDTNNDGSTTGPARGDWIEIQFADNSNDATSLIDHALIRYSGGTTCCSYVYYGAITLLGASPTIQNSTIRDSANYAYRADLNSFPTLTNNTLINNGINGLALTGDVYGTTLNTSATWNITDTTYYIRDAIAIGANKTLTITPGVVVKFEIGRYLLVNGNNSALRGLGTSLSPVTFTSLRDDTVGGDTNNDGSTTGPARGDWIEIQFADNSNDAASLIDHALIRYSGGTTCCGYVYYGAITLLGASPTIQNSTIRDSANYGMKTNSSIPTLGCNNIYDNTKYGIFNETTGITVTAKNQWWGSPAGPFSPNNTASAGIDFTPWRTSPCGPPSAPALTVTTASETQINLTWTDTSSDELDFHIERSPDGINWTGIYTASANTTTYNNTGLICSTAYSYRVWAHYQSDDLYSNIAGAKTSPCHPSSLNAATVSRTQVDLSWQDNSPDESEFHIERSPNGATGWSEIGVVGADVTTYSDSGLSCSTTYYYRVRAHRHGDNQYSDYSNVPSATTPPCSPSGLNALTVSETQIDLTWQDNSSDETDFYIDRSPNGIDWTGIYTASANSTAYNDIGLTCSTTYYYRIRAHRHSDDQFSGYSNVADAKTSPCQPSGLAATPASRTQINLSWQDNSPDESHFYIERSPNGTTGWSQIVAVGANFTNLSSTGLWCGTSYFYRVRAYRQSDGQYSTYSDIASNTTLPCLKVYLPTVLK